jgi:hypothetical protein
MSTKINPHISRLMTFHPTMFSAMLANQKTVTRRMNCVYKPGDVVAAATGWRLHQMWDEYRPTFLVENASYCGDRIHWNTHDCLCEGKLRPARFLPRAWYHHCPLLRIVHVRQEPLQAIDEDDAILEGVQPTPDQLKTCWVPHVDAFAQLIDQLHGPFTWERNPLVWRIQFEKFQPPTAEDSSVDRMQP